ncbi:MAG: tetratricopeptide repeat protein, partial [Candidatus Obscuribacterales bacterium]|nr:tetratricopeptide repeat protein [Candidatus Obscuribacterales bacterium]
AFLFSLLCKGELEELNKFAKEFLQENKDDLLVKILLAESLLRPVHNALYNDPPLPQCLDPGLNSELERAATVLIEAVLLCESQNLPALNARCQNNLAVISFMQRRFADAQNYAEDALKLIQSNPFCRINLATALIANGNLPRALRCLDAMPRQLKNHALRLVAEIYFHSCSFEQAIQIWDLLLKQEEDRLWKIRILCRKLEVHRMLRESNKAQACVDTLLSKFQGEPETLFALAHELWQLKQPEEALETIKRAKALASNNLQKWLAWEAGRILFDNDQALSATDEYAEISEENSDSIQNREFCAALYQAGLFQAAYQRAKKMREDKQDVLPGITEIEADYLLRENRWSQAKELIKELADKVPLSARHRVALIRICSVLKQGEEVQAELAALSKIALSAELQEELEQLVSEYKLNPDPAVDNT